MYGGDNFSRCSGVRSFVLLRVRDEADPNTTAKVPALQDTCNMDSTTALPGKTPHDRTICDLRRCLPMQFLSETSRKVSLKSVSSAHACECFAAHNSKRTQTPHTMGRKTRTAFQPQIKSIPVVVSPEAVSAMIGPAGTTIQQLQQTVIARYPGCRLWVSWVKLQQAFVVSSDSTAARRKASLELKRLAERVLQNASSSQPPYQPYQPCQPCQPKADVVVIPTATRSRKLKDFIPLNLHIAVRCANFVLRECD